MAARKMGSSDYSLLDKQNPGALGIPSHAAHAKDVFRTGSAESMSGAGAGWLEAQAPSPSGRPAENSTPWALCVEGASEHSLSSNI